VPRLGAVSGRAAQRAKPSSGAGPRHSVALLPKLLPLLLPLPLLLARPLLLLAPLTLLSRLSSGWLLTPPASPPPLLAPSWLLSSAMMQTALGPRGWGRGRGFMGTGQPRPPQPCNTASASRPAPSSHLTPSHPTPPTQPPAPHLPILRASMERFICRAMSRSMRDRAAFQPSGGSAG
jgi:hypothetical protein